MIFFNEHAIKLGTHWYLGVEGRYAVFSETGEFLKRFVTRLGYYIE